MNPFECNPWFKELTANDANALLQAGKKMHLKRGEALYRKGDTHTDSTGCFFGLISGSIKASNVHENGKESIMMIIEAGNWIGESSAITHKPRPNDMIALSDIEFLSVDHLAFERLTQNYSFAMAVAKLAANRLQLLYGFIESMALQSHHVNIGYLISVLAKGGISQNEEHRPTISISQEVMAMMLGISRQTFNKELQRLVKLGYISVNYNQITINDFQALGR